MASVGESVRKAIADWSAGDVEFAMLHACNAVDGTAKKAYTNVAQVGARFKRLLRENYDVLGPMGMPGIDLSGTKWPIRLGRGKPYELLDLAEVIYRVHRCTHGHGEELPLGWKLHADANGEPRRTRLEWEAGTVALSDRIIFGMLAVAVLSPENLGQKVPVGYHLTLEDYRFEINEWWGRKKDFLTATQAIVQRLPLVTLDFSQWLLGLPEAHRPHS